MPGFNFQEGDWVVFLSVPGQWGVPWTELHRFVIYSLSPTRIELLSLGEDYSNIEIESAPDHPYSGLVHLFPIP